MSRGTKLDIFIGANIEDGWTKVEEQKKSKISNEILDPSKHSLVFQREKRRGKVVTLVGQFYINNDDATKILKFLKKTLGCGGSYKNGWMEFQGEMQKKLKELLVQKGFRFKN